MTSLTDHSVDSILRGSKDAAVGHVTGNGVPLVTQRGGGDGRAIPEEVFSRSRRATTKPRLELERPELWHQFYGLCTEMVITKTGR